MKWLKNNVLILMMAIILSFSFSGMVFADAPATPPTLDLSVKAEDQSYKSLLQPIFGLEASSGKVGGASQLKGVFEAFNSIVLMFGGIILAYTLFVGTMHTAHDGEMLGKKWSSVWVPVRTMLGISMVFPTSTGFSLIQSIVLMLVMQGVGGANLIWSEFNKSIPIEHNYSTTIDDKKLNEVARAMFVNNVCLLNQEKLYKEQISTGVEDVSPGMKYQFITMPSTKIPGETSGGNIIFAYGRLNTAAALSGSQTSWWSTYKNAVVDVTKIGLSKTGVIETPHTGSDGTITHDDDAFQEICGYVSVNTAQLLKNKNSDLNGANLTGSLAVSEAKINELRQKVHQTMVSSLTTLNSKIKGLAQAIINNKELIDCVESSKCNQKQGLFAGAAGVDMNLDTLIQDSYTNQIKGVTESFMHDNVSNEAFLEAIKQDGWLFAGAYFMVQMKTRNELAISTNISTTSEMVKNNDVTVVADVQFDSALQKSKNMSVADCASSAVWSPLKKSATVGGLVGAGVVIATGGTALPLVAGAGAAYGMYKMSTDKDTSNRIIDCMVENVGLSGAFQKSANINENFVLRTQNEGASLTSIGEGIIALGLAAGFIPVIRSNITLFTILNTLGIALIVLGMTLQVYFPMLPYIIWMATVFGWLVVVAEAVIAAPLWAIMHIHPHGEEFAGKAGQGYTLLLVTVMKPPLMVLGFIFATIIINPIGNLLNNTFYSVYQMTDSGDMLGVATSIAAMIIYIGLLMALFKKVFGLIYEIPDAVVRWIGGHGQLGKNARQIGQETNTYIGGVMRQGGQGLQNGVQQGAQQVGSGLDAIKNKKLAEAGQAKVDTAQILAGENSKDGEIAHNAQLLRGTHESKGQKIPPSS